MKIFKKFQQIVKRADLFSTTEFYRFKGQEQFKSNFGGLVSTLLFFLLAAIFYVKMDACLQRQNVIYTSEIVNSADPTILKISTYPLDTFMIAIGISEFDLNDPNRNYFDIELTNSFYSFELNETSNQKYQVRQDSIISFEPCTQTHWKGFGETSQDSKLVNISRFVCAPMNKTFVLQGKSISEVYSNLKISLTWCDSRGQGRTDCVSTWGFLRMLYYDIKQILLKIYFTNVIINPSNPNHLTYFADDRYSVKFDINYGTKATVHMQDWTVATDNDIHFLQDTHVQAGGLVEEPIIPSRFYMDSQYTFASLTFCKSISSKFFQRSFEKIQDVLAFVGGLFGIFSSLLFLVSFYNDSLFQISACSRLFSINSQNKNPLKKYNFFQFLKQNVHAILRKVNLTSKWKSIEIYDECRNEMNKNFDVLYFLQRVLFLESAISVVLEGHQVKALHLREKVDIEQVKKKRDSSKVEKSIVKLKRISLKKKQSLDLAKESFTIEEEKNFEKSGFLLKSQKKDESQVNIKGALDKNQRQKNYFSLQNFADKHSQTSSESNSYSEDKFDIKDHRQIVQQIQKLNKQAILSEGASKKIMRMSSLNSTFLNSNQLDNKFLSTQKSYIEPQILNKSISNQLQDENQIESNKVSKFESQSNVFRKNRQNPSAISVNQNKYLIQAQQQISENRNSSKLKITQIISKLIKRFDYFSTTQFFRFKSDLDHRTFFGGTLSILLFASLIVIFYQNFVDCLNRTKIYAREEKIISADPTVLNISTYPKQKFMALVQLELYNLSAAPRHFDIFMQQNIRKYDERQNQWQTTSASFKLETCTKQHWEWVPQFDSFEKLIDFSTVLCLPMDTTFSLLGKKSSNQYHTLDIVVEKCTDDFDPSRPCYQPPTGDNVFFFDLFDWIFEQKFQLLISNPLIVANSENYLSHYIDDRAWAVVEMNVGARFDYFFEDYSVTTDQSIYPFSSDIVETGGIFLTLPSITNFHKTENTTQLARITFSKSASSMKYYRSFQKIQQVVAFIGGLFGIFTSCLFFVLSYNTMAYEILIGYKLFKPSQKSSKNIFKRYNFFSYLKHVCYRLMVRFGVSAQWDSIQNYQNCQQQIEKQLDIIELNERLCFIESAITVVLEEHEVKGLHLREKLSLEDAKRQRKVFKLKRQIKKLHKNEDVNQKDGQINKRNEKDDMESETSSSDESSDMNDEKEKETIWQEIEKIKQEASTGQRMSKKIMDLTSSSIGELLSPKRKQKEVHHQEDSPQKLVKSRFEIAEIDNDEHDKQEQSNEKFNPFRLKESKKSKFAESKIFKKQQ